MLRHLVKDGRVGVAQNLEEVGSAGGDEGVTLFVENSRVLGVASSSSWILVLKSAILQITRIK